MQKKIMKKDLLEIISEAKILLEKNYVTKPCDDGTINGWHNFFENKVGTTGSAFPIIFYKEVNDEFSKTNEVIETLIKLRRSVKNDEYMSWSILSVPNSNTIEGSILPTSVFLEFYKKEYESIIMDSIHWIENIQLTNGGWNSNGNQSAPARILLTCNALELLWKANRGQNTESIKKGLDWIKSVRNSDGSWGAFEKDEGSIFFTAKVLNLLVKPKYTNDTFIKKSREFITGKLVTNDINRFEMEVYDIHLDRGYNRITLEHDTYAEVLKLFSMTQNKWKDSLVFKVISDTLDDYKKNGFNNSFTEKESIWTIIPLTISIHLIYEQYLPYTSNEWYLLLDCIISSDDEDINSNFKFLVNLFILKRKKTILKFLGLIFIIILFILYLIKVLDLKEMIISIIFPLILFFLGLKKDK